MLTSAHVVAVELQSKRCRMMLQTALLGDNNPPPLYRFVYVDVVAATVILSLVIALIVLYFGIRRFLIRKRMPDSRMPESADSS